VSRRRERRLSSPISQRGCSADHRTPKPTRPPPPQYLSSASRPPSPPLMPPLSSMSSFSSSSSSSSSDDESPEQSLEAQRPRRGTRRTQKLVDNSQAAKDVVATKGKAPRRRKPGKKALAAAAEMSQLLDGYLPPPSSAALSTSRGSLAATPLPNGTSLQHVTSKANVLLAVLHRSQRIVPWHPAMTSRPSPLTLLKSLSNSISN
jgi:hypothetical protein